MIFIVCPSSSSGDAVQLSCDSHTMTVVVDLERFAVRFPDVDPASLSLRDDRCRPTLDGARLVWRFSLDECRTRRHVSDVTTSWIIVIL